MLYTERINHLLEKIDGTINELQAKFYFAEPDQMHQKLGGGWSAVEELEYANLRGYHYLDMLKKLESKKLPSNTPGRHRIRFFADYVRKREAQRPDAKALPDDFLPVSQRDNPEPVRIKEQKVFSDLLDLLDAWRLMLTAGLESEDLRKVKLRGGLLNIFTLDALEIATVSIEIIENQLSIAKEAVAQRGST